ncbi:hypothetical protein [Haloarchaeobius sp. TZWWS8]|uniref:DUF7838 family putative zinc beta-ribbon protein n=1 Tax=Haloarchaeobius sp. TZWWS8 TaxID=3446121 RepID=UPI003EBDF17F
MTLEIEHYCPTCEEEETFYKAASTNVHLGKKMKWHCTECDYGFVKIDGAVDTSEA